MDDALQTRLEDLKPAPYNPRRVTQKQRKLLKQALLAFGDLGGIVFNRKTGNLVGGHQRIQAFKADPESRLRITRELQHPSPNGTVADGHIDVGGERFAYREVLWDEQTERLANLAANKSAGRFDTAQLADTLQVLSQSNLDLSLSMFDADELRAYLPETREIQAAPAALQDMEAGRPERLRGATAHPADAPHAEAPEAPSIKQVTLYFRGPDMEKFNELVDALKDVFHRSNVSDVVLEAVKRASITAAFK